MINGKGFLNVKGKGKEGGQVGRFFLSKINIIINVLVRALMISNNHMIKKIYLCLCVCVEERRGEERKRIKCAEYDTIML